MRKTLILVSLLSVMPQADALERTSGVSSNRLGDDANGANAEKNAPSQTAAGQPAGPSFTGPLKIGNMALGFRCSNATGDSAALASKLATTQIVVVDSSSPCLLGGVVVPAGRVLNLNGASIRAASLPVLMVAADSTIIGPGTMRGNLAPGAFIRATEHSISGLTLRDITIDDTSSRNSGSIGLDLSGVSVADVDNVWIRNIETGVKISGVAFYNTFKQLTVRTAVTGVVATAAGNTFIGGSIGTVGTCFDLAESASLYGVQCENFRTGVAIRDGVADVRGGRFENRPVSGTAFAPSGTGYVTASGAYLAVTVIASAPSRYIGMGMMLSGPSNEVFAATNGAAPLTVNAKQEISGDGGKIPALQIDYFAPDYPSSWYFQANHYGKAGGHDFLGGVQFLAQRDSLDAGTVFYSWKTKFGEAPPTTRMVLDTTGSLGIGTRLPPGGPKSPLTAAGDVTVYDSSSLSSELVRSNAACAGWTLGSGWRCRAGSIVHTPGTGTAAAHFPANFRPGEYLRSAFTVSGLTAGSVSLSIGGAATGPTAANGTHGFDLAPIAPGDLSFTPSNEFDGSVAVSSLSLKRIVGGSLHLAGAIKGKSNQIAGTITIENGSTNATVIFDAAYSVPPVCVLTPTGGELSSAGSYWVTTSRSAIRANVSSAPRAAVAFNYVCIGSPY